MNICNILLETFGASRVRLTIESGQDATANNLFSNLVWVCSEVGRAYDIESFTVTTETLIKAIQSFRASNIVQGRRGKGKWKQSPFRFTRVNQRNDTRQLDGEGLQIGCHQDNLEDWDGWKVPRIEKSFDKPENFEPKE